MTWEDQDDISLPTLCLTLKIRHSSLAMIAISAILCFLSPSPDFETTLCSWLTPSTVVLDNNVCRLPQCISARDIRYFPANEDNGVGVLIDAA